MDYLWDDAPELLKNTPEKLKLDNLENKCHELMAILNSKRRTATVSSPTEFLQVSAYQGAVESNLGKVHALQKDWLRALIYFKQAQQDFMIGRCLKEELVVIKNYMLIAPFFFSLKNDVERIEGIEQLKKICSRAKTFVGPGVDENILKHNIALLNRLQSNLSIELFIQLEEHRAIFPLYGGKISSRIDQPISMPNKGILLNDPSKKTAHKTKGA